MALVLPLNSPLFPNYKEVIRFTSTNRNAYFLSKSIYFSATGNNAQYVDINMNWNDGLETIINVPIIGTPSPNLKSPANRVHEYLSFNYLHVVDNLIGQSAPFKQFFYFIKKARLVSAEVVEYSVELDVWTTYENTNMITQPIMTERKHCNRFFKVGTGASTRYRFRTDDTMLGDELDSQFKALLPTNMQTLKYEYFKAGGNITNTAENSFLRDRINDALSSTLWMYAFFTPKESDSNKTGTSIYTELLTDPSQQPFDTGVRVLFAPVKAMRLNNTTTTTQRVWSAYLLYKMIKDDELNPYTISIRFSPIAPFSNWMNFGAGGLTDTTFDFFTPEILRFNFTAPNNTADANIIVVDGGSTSDHWFVKTGFGSGTNTSKWGDDERLMLGLLNYTTTQNPYGSPNYHLLETTNMNMGAIGMINDTQATIESTALSKTYPKSVSYEPKLMTNPYKRMEVSTGYSQERQLSPLYFVNGLTTQDVGGILKFECLDIPSASDQKYAYGVSRTIDNYYFPNDILFGNALRGNNIYEMPIAQDQFANYVANHSNWMISGIALPLVQSGVSAIASQNPMALAGGVSSALNFGIQMDDLDKAPDSMKMTGNNFVHDYTLTRPLGIRVSTYDLLDEQKRQVLDYFYEFGYRINRECRWMSSLVAPSFGVNVHDALFNRTRFNYIKISDENLVRKITATEMSPIAKQKFAQILFNGVRVIESNASASITDENFNIEFENPEYSIIGN
jgi:hypothetical protein